MWQINGWLLFRILKLQHVIFLHTPLHRNNNILHLHCGSSVQISTTQACHWRKSPLTRQGSPTTETEELQLYAAEMVTSRHANTTLKIMNKIQDNKKLDLKIESKGAFLWGDLDHNWSVIQNHSRSKYVKETNESMTRVASRLVHSTLERAVQVRALAGDIVLCSLARHFTLTVLLSTQVNKWVPANLTLGGNPAMD